MSPITHFLAGWVILERTQATPRDKALVALAGIAPDLDGLGIVVDFATRVFGWPETNYYQEFHRMYGHGLPAVLVISVVAALLGAQPLRVALGTFAAVHLHFLCDLVGSRGNGPDDIWGIYYLAPVSLQPHFAWAGQWPLVGWQNMAITAVLLGIVFWRATNTGYTPLLVVSPRADAELVGTLRKWRGRGAPDRN